jgi:glutamate decarboxylase
MPLRKKPNNQYDTMPTSVYGSPSPAPVVNNTPENLTPSPRTAYDLLQSETYCHGNEALNLATFITTALDAESKQHIVEFIDHSAPLQRMKKLQDLETPCVQLLAKLWNNPFSDKAVGCATTDASEACMLAGLSMLQQWKMHTADSSKPNLVLSSNAQAGWEKFCQCWHIEMREAPMASHHYVMDPNKAIQLCDENTIGIVAVLGGSLTGEYEPIQALDHALSTLNQRKEWNIPLHVDATNGGLITPFLQPQLTWDFRLSCVTSIHAAGHQSSNTIHPGIGWIVWRHADDLQEDAYSFSSRFSKPKASIIAQYYDFLQWGIEKHQRTQQTCQHIAMYIAEKINQMGPFKLLSDGRDLPVFAWTLKRNLNFTLHDLAERLHYCGWAIPVYAIPGEPESVVLRAVIREGFSYELADLLIGDLHRCLSHFKQQSDADESAKKTKKSLH